MLFEHGTMVSSVTEGVQAIHLAAQKGHAAALAALLRCKADVDAQVKHESEIPLKCRGKQAIHFAAEYGSIEALSVLIEHHADVDTQNSHGLCPVSLAALQGSLEVVQLLERKGAKLTTLRDTDSWTVTHSAAAGGNLGLLQWLLERGADVLVPGTCRA